MQMTLVFLTALDRLLGRGQSLAEEKPQSLCHFFSRDNRQAVKRSLNRTAVYSSLSFV